jgi:cell division protein FtsW
MFNTILKKFEIGSLNKIILISAICIIIIGLLVFLSASIGLMGRNEVKFYSILDSQFKAYVIGIVAAIVGLFLPYKLYYKYAIFIFVIALLLAIAVLVPGIGFAHGGATRWISIAGFSLQPGEILKISTVFITAWFVKKFQNRFDDVKISAGIFMLIISSVSVIMYLQKDLGTLLIILFTAGAIYFLGGARWQHLFILIIPAVLFVAVYTYKNPYVLARFHVYKNANVDPLGSSYQTKQALIAIGSGGMLGRGPGQSVQKFSFLPEPVGDSIFAVAGEELGFVGATTIVLLFSILIAYTFLYAKKCKDQFARSVIIGICIVFYLQTILNIASMLDLIPLSGDILPFFSQGGTALIVNLFSVGLLLQLTKKNN